VATRRAECGSFCLSRGSFCEPGRAGPRQPVRRLHFVGSTLALLCLFALFLTGNFWFLLGGLLFGYGFAWIGHFGFEKNRPASFKRPLYSFRGDWVMWRDILTGRIPL
jgi:hypothetical protein